MIWKKLAKGATVASAFALGAGLTALAIAGGAIVSTIFSLTSSDWASWVQAVGSIAAIIGAYLISSREMREQRERDRMAQDDMLRPEALKISRAVGAAIDAANRIARVKDELRRAYQDQANSIAERNTVTGQIIQRIDEGRRTIALELTGLEIPQGIADAFTSHRSAVTADIAVMRALMAAMARAARERTQVFEEDLPAISAFGRRLERRLFDFAAGEADYPDQMIDMPMRIAPAQAANAPAGS